MHTPGLLFARAVAAEVAERSFEELAAAFERASIWYARVEDYDDLRRNPQALHNETFRDVVVNGETVTLVNHPIRYDGRVPEFKGFALTPGTHSRELLAESGYDDGEIAALMEGGVVHGPLTVAEGQER